MIRDFRLALEVLEEFASHGSVVRDKAAAFTDYKRAERSEASRVLTQAVRGKAGGEARAAKLTPAQRSEVARLGGEAARVARWKAIRARPGTMRRRRMDEEQEEEKLGPQACLTCKELVDDEFLMNGCCVDVEACFKRAGYTRNVTDEEVEARRGWKPADAAAQGTPKPTLASVEAPQMFSIDLLRACCQEVRLVAERMTGLAKLLENALELAENPTAPPKPQPLTIGIDKEMR